MAGCTGRLLSKMARIILLDDEPQLLRTLARFLEREGHDVRAGERFDQVEGYLRPGRFEVLVSDIIMPEMSGMAVLEEVAEKRGCQEPVILITGEPNLETASEAVRRGAFDYISKPVTKSKLLETVGRGLRHVRLLRERDRARRAEMEILKNLALIGESASILSHEVRTPLTSLRHALRAVAHQLKVEDRVMVEELVNGLNRIERLMNQTLSFAKPLRLEREEVAVSKLIEDSIEQVRTLPGLEELSVHVECGEDPRLRVDAQLLGEVIVNLIKNAGEAVAGKGSVVVRARSRDGNVVLEIADEGPGISAEIREDLFKPFHTSKEGGTGLGLAFCRKVVESHGGTIGLVDASGHGACFRIELGQENTDGC